MLTFGKLFLPVSGCLGFMEGTKERAFLSNLVLGFKGEEVGFIIVRVIEILKGKINL